MSSAKHSRRARFAARMRKLRGPGFGGMVRVVERDRLGHILGCSYFPTHWINGVADFKVCGGDTINVGGPRKWR